MKLLVKKRYYFVDPHGSPDEAGVEKFVSEDMSYLDKHGKWYQYGSEIEDEDELQGSEDGYNATAEFYEVKKLKNIEANAIIKLIKDYEKL